jgi:hypothetical protein
MKVTIFVEVPARTDQRRIAQEVVTHTIGADDRLAPL